VALFSEAWVIAKDSRRALLPMWAVLLAATVLLNLPCGRTSGAGLDYGTTHGELDAELRLFTCRARVARLTFTRWAP